MYGMLSASHSLSLTNVWLSARTNVLSTVYNCVLLNETSRVYLNYKETSI